MVLVVSSKLQLFIDDWVVDTMSALSLRLHSPTPREVALRFDAPWEGPWSTYVTVMKDSDRYRMYYRGAGRAGTEVTCYAESPDGIAWTKPSLGIHDFEGSKSNNIIWTGFGKHNFTPFKDLNPNASSDERYKAVAGGPLMALASPDGIHWTKLRDEPIITRGSFDSQNLAFWDTEQSQYVAYIRDFRDDIRQIKRCTSPDFNHWTEPEWLEYGDTPLEHFYTNAVTPYFRASQLYLGFPKRFMPHRHAVKEQPEPGVSDAVFMSSRDGLHWDRRFMEAFIRPGLDRENWTHRSNMPAWGIVPTSPEETSLYYTEHYDHSTCRLRRATLRVDGFVSVHADYAGGDILTKPLVFEGRELVVNYSTSAVGSIRVELQDEAGKPISGHALEEADELYGDEVERIVTWRPRSDVTRLQGRPVRLRFAMKDADLYSFRFRP